MSDTLQIQEQAMALQYVAQDLDTVTKRLTGILADVAKLPESEKRKDIQLEGPLSNNPQAVLIYSAKERIANSVAQLNLLADNIKLG
jgi:hypothetical protein